MNKTILLLLTSLLICLSANAIAEAELKSEKQKLGYAMGAYFSQGVKQQVNEIDIDAFIQAVEDVLKNTELRLSTEEIQQVLTNYQEKLKKNREAVGTDNISKGRNFLEENKKKEGIVTLDSGLQYKVLKKGSGDKPKSDSSVKVHYHGTLISGQVFDSSYDRGEPISLSLTRVIKGWQEALPLMPVGSKWQIFVPANLAYGDRGAGSIGPNETLIFDIELLSIE